MRTSLNEIKEIEEYLLNHRDYGNRLVMHAKMMLNPQLMQNILVQRHIVKLIRSWGRKKTKLEAEEIGKNLLAEPGNEKFQNEIKAIFSN